MGMAFRTPKPRTSSIPPLPNTSLAAPSTLPRSPVTSSKLAAAGAREESERLWNRTRVLEAELAVRWTQTRWHKPTPQAKLRKSTILASFSMFTAALLALSTCLLYKKCPPCDTSLLVAFYYRGGMQILLDFTVAS